MWNVEDGSLITVLRGHEGAVERATFSPDGSRVITGARDGTARVWNARSGEQILLLRQPGNNTAALFSPDGMRVLTASDSSDPTLWDAKTGKKILTLQGYIISSATFNPDGRRFATAHGFERTVKIWSTEDGRLIKQLNNGDWPDGVEFSPDGARILVSSLNTIRFGFVSRLWDVTSGVEMAALRGHKSDTIEGRSVMTVTSLRRCRSMVPHGCGVAIRANYETYLAMSPAG